MLNIIAFAFICIQKITTKSTLILHMMIMMMTCQKFTDTLY